MKNIKSIENYLGFKVGDLVEIQCDFLSVKEYKGVTAPKATGHFCGTYLKEADLLLCIWINPPKENGNNTGWYQIGFLKNNGSTVWRFFDSINSAVIRIKEYILLEKNEKQKHEK